MLRGIVGLNRKLSRNFHSTGFSINDVGAIGDTTWIRQVA